MPARIFLQLFDVLLKHTHTNGLRTYGSLDQTLQAASARPVFRRAPFAVVDLHSAPGPHASTSFYSIGTGNMQSPDRLAEPGPDVRHLRHLQSHHRKHPRSDRVVSIGR